MRYFYNNSKYSNIFLANYCLDIEGKIVFPYDNTRGRNIDVFKFGYFFLNRSNSNICSCSFLARYTSFKWFKFKFNHLYMYNYVRSHSDVFNFSYQCRNL